MLVKDGKVWCGGYFQLKQNKRLLLFDAQGFWSYPAFVLGGNGEVLWLHLVLSTESEKNFLKLFRPRAMALTAVGTNLLVEYHDFRFGTDPFPELEWDQSVSSYPWRELRKYSVDDLKKLETRLLLLSDRAASEFGRAGTLPVEYAEIYAILNHPVFVLYLNVVAPAFLSALSPFLDGRKP